MFLAVAYVQNLDPAGNRFLSTLVAAAPVIVLFFLLVVRGCMAPKAGAAGVVVAVLGAWLVYGMPFTMAAKALFQGAAFGLLPIGWTVFSAMLIYNVTVESGRFAVIRRSVASLSSDARLQAILIGFAFGAFLEGAAGAGSPVAICGAMLVGLGFPPHRAAVLCLLANTSPVAFGGLGVPILTLSGTAFIPPETLSVMAGHQLPLLSCIIPLYMVILMVGWRQSLQVWPALVVAGGSFAGFQYLFATFHLYFPGLVLFQMTDIGGGIFALLTTAAFLQFWKPKNEWHYPASEGGTVLLDDASSPPLTTRTVLKAYGPFALMSVCLLLAGLMRQRETRYEREHRVPEIFTGLQTKYEPAIPGLDKEVQRAERLRRVTPDGQRDDTVEGAVVKLEWLTAPGTPVFLAALISMAMLRMTYTQAVRCFRRTLWQMRIPIPTIACMLGLSYVTRYAGMDATLGVAFAETGVLYPFFAAILGWLGVFLTGTDAGSNALFGSLQKITAGEVYAAHHDGVFSHLTRGQAEVLICTANSTGGVMGKMIDAQSICVATAGTNQIGKEGKIFKSVLIHSIILATIVGLLTLAQAYLPPFTRMVPK